MISLNEAKEIVAANLPEGSTYQKQVKYNNLYIFIVVINEPGDEFVPVFVSVDDMTGEFKDMQPWEVGDPKKLERLLMEAE